MKTIVWIAALALVTGCAANASEEGGAGAGTNQPAGDNTGDPNGAADSGSGGDTGSSTPTPTDPGLGTVDKSQEQACPMTDIPPAGDPTYNDGNPTCFDLYGTEFPGIQQLKIDTTFTDGVYQMPDGFDVTVHFTGPDSFDYNCAEASLKGIFVKAGAGGNLYTTSAYGGSGLHTPKGYAFSHIEFCYDPNGGAVP